MTFLYDSCFHWSFWSFCFCVFILFLVSEDICFTRFSVSRPDMIPAFLMPVVVVDAIIYHPFRINIMIYFS